VPRYHATREPAADHSCSRRARRAACGGALVLAVLVTLSACHSAAGTATRPHSAFPASIADQLPTAIPTAQAAALSDGTVTRAEYEAAYQAFAACVHAGGGSVEVLNENGAGVYTYRTGARLGTPKEPLLDSVEGRCYHDTFDVVEFVYQTTDPAALAAATADGQHAVREPG